MTALDNFRRHINELIANKKTSIVAIHKKTRIARNLLYGYLVDGKEIDLRRAEIIAQALDLSLREIIGDEKPTLAAYPLERDKIKAMELILRIDDGDVLGDLLAYMNQLTPLKKGKSTASGE